MTLAQRVELALVLEPMPRKQAKERQLATLKQNADTVRQDSVERAVHQQKSDEANKDVPREYNWTNQTIGREAGVSHDTVSKYKRIKKDALGPIQEMVRNEDGAGTIDAYES